MFWYRLAAHQRRSVSECQAATGSEEFAGWIAFWQYYTLDPDGWQQTWKLYQLIASALGGKDVKLEQCVPIKKRPQSAEQQLALMRISAIGKKNG